MSGAYCRADGDLMAADRSPSQQQTRNVSAGDQEYKGHGTKQDQQTLACIADQLFTQRNHPKLHKIVEPVRVFPCDAVLDRFQLATRLLQRYARLQPRHDIQDRVVAATYLSLGCDVAGNVGIDFSRVDIRRCGVRNKKRKLSGRTPATVTGRPFKTTVLPITLESKPETALKKGVAQNDDVAAPSAKSLPYEGCTP